MTVYLLLFYLSQENNYNYSFKTTINELSRILETNQSVVIRALESLEQYHMIHFHSHGDEIHITINPITVNN